LKSRTRRSGNQASRPSGRFRGSDGALSGFPSPTGAEFGAVGALFLDPGDGRLRPVCTGSLVAPTVFLTAAHCLASQAPSAALFVTFAPSVGFPPAPDPVVRAEAFVFHPGFRTQPALATAVNDLGVVLLPPTSTPGVTPLGLPAAGRLDLLSANSGLRGEDFLNVGYGVSASSRGPSSLMADGIRKVSTSPFQVLTADWLGLLMNGNATGEGGVCLFDSGAPTLLAEDPHVVLGVTSWVDPTCRAGFSQRLDTPAAREFLGRFVSLP
jgi:hypothetical protein